MFYENKSMVKSTCLEKIEALYLKKNSNVRVYFIIILGNLYLISIVIKIQLFLKYMVSITTSFYEIKEVIKQSIVGWNLSTCIK